MIGIGIDTGGTCTDAVLYDTERQTVLAAAKDATTHDDLKIGIRKALEKMPGETCVQAEYVALSTTLATNACVEQKGARAGLILIGAYPKVVQQYAYEYGLPPMPELCLVGGTPGEKLQLDMAELEAELRKKFAHVDSIAIAQAYPEKDGGALEREMAEVVREVLNKPCILSSELFHEANILKRGASALLNARLIPVMNEFIAAVQTVLREKGIDVPVWIVRSDGTLMSIDFAMSHPVETLLCGPAASVIGGRHFCHEKNALIVDMGGTTTDISMVEDGIPVKANEGIAIGAWHTAVKGVYIQTFGLGGDSRIVRTGKQLDTDSRRCVPLCALCAQYPAVAQELQALAQGEPAYDLPLHEYFVLRKQNPDAEKYEADELALCAALKDRPLSLRALSEATGIMMDVLPLKRLENEGVILRAGLTPTDIMHIRGRFCAFDASASRYAARWFARCLQISEDVLCDRVDAAVIKKLYCALAKILLEKEPLFPSQMKGKDVLPAMAEYLYVQALQGGAMSRTNFISRAMLVGIGAPTAYYLHEAARLLGAETVLPQYAAMANAVGAAVSCICAQINMKLRPDGEEFVLTGDGIAPMAIHTKNIAAAVEEAKSIACSAAQLEAERRGALGKIDVDVTAEKVDASLKSYGGDIFIRVDITARAKAALC